MKIPVLNLYRILFYTIPLWGTLWIPSLRAVNEPNDCKRTLENLQPKPALRAFRDGWSGKGKQGLNIEQVLRGTREHVDLLQKFLLTPIKKANKGGNTLQSLFEIASTHLQSTQAKALREWVLGQFFEDPVVSFEDNYLGRQKTAYPEGPNRYNKHGERPFEGYLSARDWLEPLPLEKIGLSEILELHKKLMSRTSIQDPGKVFQIDRTPARNSQGLKDSELGVFRDGGVSFQTDGQYLPQGYAGPAVTTKTLLRGNPFLVGKEEGKIGYLPLSIVLNPSKRTLLKISPELSNRIWQLGLTHGAEALDQQDSPEVKRALQQLVKELTLASWENAKTRIQTAQTNEEVISAAAGFLREFNTLHPFFDGNGRVARLLTEKLLNSKGLSSPLYTHWGEDLALSTGDLETLIARGAMFSRDFQKQLTNSIKSGKGFETVLNPALEERAKELLGDPLGSFDSKAFLKWCETHRERVSTFSEAVQEFVKDHPSHLPGLPELKLEDQLEVGSVLGDYFSHWEMEQFQMWQREHSNPGEDIRTAALRYVEWKRLHDYRSSNDSVQLIPPRFQQSFGKLSSSAEEYQKKMDRYYDSSQAIYRGVPVSHYLSDIDLAGLFQQLTPLTLGNGVEAGRGPESILPIFQQFNAGILRDDRKMVQQAKDHADGENQNYFSSGMLSFTERPDTARNFQFYDGAKTGVLFTAHKPKVGFIESRKENRRFGIINNRYEGEKEITVIGGLDPESLTEIKLEQTSKTGGNQVTRFKTAQRLSFNQIKITETQLDAANQPLGAPKTTIWELHPNRKPTQIQ